MPPNDCNRLCTTEARDSGCKTMWVLQPPFVSPVVAGGVGKPVLCPPPPPPPTLSSPCSQVRRAGLDRLSEGLTLGEPTETHTPPRLSLSFSFWISFNKRERCCASLDQPFPFGRPGILKGNGGSPELLLALRASRRVLGREPPRQVRMWPYSVLTRHLGSVPNGPQEALHLRRTTSLS